jgi:hypothetical protein
VSTYNREKEIEMKYRILDVHSTDAHFRDRECLIGHEATPTFWGIFDKSDVGDGYWAGEFYVFPPVFDEEPFFFLAVKLEKIKE